MEIFTANHLTKPRNANGRAKGRTEEQKGFSTT
jgi:hypothetical protein